MRTNNQSSAPKAVGSRKPAGLKAIVAAAVIVSIVNSTWAIALYHDLILTGSLVAACCLSARICLREEGAWLRVFVTSVAMVISSLAWSYTLPSSVFLPDLVQPKLLAMVLTIGGFLPIVFGMVKLLADALDSWWTKYDSATSER